MHGGMASTNPGKRVIYIGYAVIILCGILLLSCARSGFGWNDESNYLAMTDRLFRGDRLIVHEWHPSQWFTVFLLPFYSLYRWITGSADGSLLFMRILYALFSTCTALIVYRSFHSFKGVWLALAGALLILFPARGFPGILSYNTIPPMFLVLTSAAIYSYANGQGRRLIPFAAGAAFAVAAGSYPYLGAFYFLALVAAMILWKRVSSRWRTFIGFSALGIAVVALPYIAYVLRGGDVELILNGMRFIFNDPEHIYRSPYQIVRSYFYRILSVYGATLLPNAALILYVLIKRAARIKIGSAEGLTLLLTGMLACCVQIILKGSERGVAPYSLALVGFQAFLQAEKPDRPMFYGVFLPGFLYSLASHYSSNVGFRAVASGLAVSSMASVCLLWDCASALDSHDARRIRLPIRATVALTLAVGLGALSLPFIKGAIQMPFDKTSVTIQQGPAKALRVPPNEAERYQATYDMINQYASGEGNLIITRLAPWAYMASTMRCGAPTTWRLRFNEDRLKTYMELFPDRKPDLIISLRPAYDPKASAWRLPEDNVGPEKLNRALLDYAAANGMERVDTQCAVLFRRVPGNGQD